MAIVRSASGGATLSSWFTIRHSPFTINWIIGVIFIIITVANVPQKMWALFKMQMALWHATQLESNPLKAGCRSQVPNEANIQGGANETHHHQLISRWQPNNIPARNGQSPESNGETQTVECRVSATAAAAHIYALSGDFAIATIAHTHTHTWNANECRRRAEGQTDQLNEWMKCTWHDWRVSKRNKI